MYRENKNMNQDAHQTILRGDLYYADLSPVVGSEQGGIRPVLVIQNDVGNKYSRLKEYIGHLDSGQMAGIEQAMVTSLGLGHLTGNMGQVFLPSYS